MQDMNDEPFSILERTIEAIVKKSFKMAEGLPVNEQYRIMKKILLDGIDQVVERMSLSGQYDVESDEFKQKLEELKQVSFNHFDKQYAEEKISCWEASENGETSKR